MLVTSGTEGDVYRGRVHWASDATPRVPLAPSPSFPKGRALDEVPKYLI